MRSLCGAFSVPENLSSKLVERFTSAYRYTNAIFEGYSRFIKNLYFDIHRDCTIKKKTFSMLMDLAAYGYFFFTLNYEQI